MKKSTIMGLISGITWSLSAIIVAFVFLFEPFAGKLDANISGLVSAGLGEFSGFIFLFILMLSLGKLKDIINSKGKKFVMLGAFLSGPVGMTMYYISIKYIGQSFSDAITGIYPVLVVIFAAIFFKERYNFKVYIGIFLTVVGIYLLVTASLSGKLNISGLIFALTTAISWSMEALLLDYTSVENDLKWDAAIFTRQMTTALSYILIVIPIALFVTHTNTTLVFNVFSNSKLTILILINGLFIATSYATFYYAISNGGAAIPAILNMSYIGWTPLLSFILYPLAKSFGIPVESYSLDTLFFIAAPIIVVGVISVIWFSNKDENYESDDRHNKNLNNSSNIEDENSDELKDH